MAVLYQVIATVIVCFPCVNMGVMYAWPSSTIGLFTSPNTTMSRRMTEFEVSVFGSLSSVGAMVGTVVLAALLDRIGRKNCTIIAGLASVVSWATIACTSNLELILAAVFLSGFGGASFLIVPVFVSEFTQESIRGTMASCSMVFYGVGLLISYILGGYFSYMAMIYIAMAFAAVEVGVMSWLKESPLYLLKQGKEKEAIESIAFYRQVPSDSKVIGQELINLRLALNPEITESIPEEVYLRHSENPTGSLESINDGDISKSIQNTKKLTVWQFYTCPTCSMGPIKYLKWLLPSEKSRPTQRGLVITMALMSAAMLQGLVVVQVYAEPLFAEAVPDMSPALCSVLFAVAIAIASFVAAYMSDIVGRRPLMTYSSIGSAICCILLGTQIQLGWAPSWVTAVIMYMFCAVYSFGGGTVPFVLLAEVFLPEVKSFMTMLVVEWMWICSFLILLIFNPLVAIIGLGPTFYLFTFICILSAIFSIYYVPETKGLTLDMVQTLLNQKTYV